MNTLLTVIGHPELIVLQPLFQSMVLSMCFGKGGGNSLTRATAEDQRRNMEIDKMIRKDKKSMARQVKILLLGESTIWKALTAIGGNRH